MLEKYVHLMLSFFSMSLCLNILDVFNFMLVLNEQDMYIQLHFCIVQKNKILHKVWLIKPSRLKFIKRILWLLEYYLGAIQVQRRKKCKASLCEECELWKDHEEEWYYSFIGLPQTQLKEPTPWAAAICP